MDMEGDITTSEAEQIADRISSDCELDSIEVKRVSPKSIKFHHTGLIHAHLIPDGWEIGGFSTSGWFRLDRTDK